ncbi:MAG: hypothetical protein HYU37_03895 [Acidobacteria bacterium]|nr:hypothetical protein [Acidobacteriota bacterium]
MSSSSLRMMAVAVGLLIVSASASAHHSAAIFDPNKRVTVTGIVTEWFWANPHCLLSLDVKGADGQVVKWVAETQAPPNMIPYGWSRQSFKAGEEVTITVEQARSGKPVGRLLRAQFPDGRTLLPGGSAGAAAAGAQP